MSYKVLGISAGNGVSLYPFKDQVIGNIEPRAIFHSPGDMQWQVNFPNAPIYNGKEPLKKLKLKPDVIISSPDCGSGSILRLSVAKEYGDIKENKSLNLFFESIQVYKPDFFYFENLPGMFRSLPKESFSDLLPNYNLTFHEASVVQWGNSQLHRVRLVIIGARKDLNCNWEYLFRLPDKKDQMKTCFELYGDLDERGTTLRIGHVREPKADVVTVYSKFKCTIRECIQYWKDHPKAKRWQVLGRRFSNAPGVYRNRKNDYPATARKANRQFDHNGLMLTPRQLARIQGVPDDFEIYMDANKLKYWINKGRATVTKTPPMQISTWFFNKLNKFYGTQ